MKQNIIVVGAGIIGATTALSLAEAGYKVDVIDKATKLGMGASGDNGAQLSYNYTDAMASPQLLKTLPKLLLGRDPSFRMIPHLDWGYIKWGFEFLKNCSQPQSDINTLSILKMALKSSLILHDWVAKYSFEFDFRAAKKLHLYENTQAFTLAQQRVVLKNQAGGNQSILSASETISLEPSLSETNVNLIGAVYSPDDEVGDVIKFTKAALSKALQLGGGRLLLNTELTEFNIENNSCYSITTTQGEYAADKVILCAGYQSSKLTKKLQQFSPIIPIAGYSLSFEANDSTPNVSLTDTSAKIVLCKLGNRLRIAGMADMGRVASSAPNKRIELLKQIVKQRFPTSADYTTDGDPWAGMRPMTPNSIPIIKRLKQANIYINSGHGMLGWTLAAGSADVLKSLLELPA